jgi:hypothetical protein
MTKANVCKKCGAHVTRQYGFGYVGTDGLPHRCQPKVKIYTEEEKRELEKQRKK